jgi:ferric-dicitrate binding protein FerR (iron transport regulator)
MGPNHQLRHEYLLERILSGELTSAEREDLTIYIEDSYRDHQLDLLMQEHWDGMEDEKIVMNDSQLLNLKIRIFDQIHQSKASLEENRRIVHPNWKSYLTRAAAVLFVPLLLGSMLLVNRMNNQIQKLTTTTANQKVVANPGSRVHFTLPDQTEVWLNSGSMLEFPLSINQQDFRKVKLSGQGYFKVAHDQEHPFFVEVDGLNIKALGTSFDVSAYISDGQISSTLEEGSIALINNEGGEIARLHPGQKAFLDKTTNVLFVKEVETTLTTSWKEGKLIFRNSSLPDVMEQLERWFNCKIHVDTKLMTAGLMYTATIQDETLGEVLKMIEISTKIKTRIEKREVYLEINY